MGVVVVIYNFLGLLFVGLGVGAGLIAHSLGLSSSASVGIAGAVTFATDLGYRRARGDMESGGQLYRIPVWILGFSFAVVTGLFLVINAFETKSPTAESRTEEPVPSSDGKPQLQRRPLLDVKVAEEFQGFLDTVQAAASSTLACDKKRQKLVDLTKQHQPLITAIYRSGQVLLPDPYAKSTWDTLVSAIEAGKTCDIDVVAILHAQ